VFVLDLSCHPLSEGSNQIKNSHKGLKLWDSIVILWLHIIKSWLLKIGEYDMTN